MKGSTNEETETNSNEKEKRFGTFFTFEGEPPISEEVRFSHFTDFPSFLLLSPSCWGRGVGDFLFFGTVQVFLVEQFPLISSFSGQSRDCSSSRRSSYSFFRIGRRRVRVSKFENRRVIRSKAIPTIELYFSSITGIFG